MREMALCRSVVDIVLEEARRARTPEVRSVHVTVGEVRDIVDDIFCDMFDWLARGTVAEHARVVITRVPLTVACDGCAAEFHIDVHDRSTWHCPSCGCERYHLRTGMEFFISDIEVASPMPAAPLGAKAEPSFEELDAIRARVAARNRAAAERDAKTCGGVKARAQRALA
ncbi:MAG: hydrogenase maturation nickel metallochaperone HypA [Coriobacteriales bacterium]|jgi:hydrogenase nickel incorporation protein HypA/HybF